MQIKGRGNTQNSYLLQSSPYKIFVVCWVIIICNSTSFAQQAADQVRDVTKKINITVGIPIKNELTEKALKAVDKVNGLQKVIHRYNERYGNDSVHAHRFVDREPDEKADDPILKNYYNVVVVSDSAEQTARWFTFLVRKDFKEVLFYDFKNSKTPPLDEWKKIWPASEFLREH